MSDQNQTRDLIIIGCGPAGLSAAVNARAREKDVLVLGGEFCSPKLHASPVVDNYLGFPGIAGKELRQKFLGHAAAMGVEVQRGRADSVYPQDEGFAVTVKTEVYSARTVILATGVTQARYLPGEREFLGRGVSYCATCDGALYRGKDVAVISETAEGEEEADFLSGLCRTVTYLPQYRSPGNLRSGVRVLEQKPGAIRGKESVTHLELDGESLPVHGVFIIRKDTPAEQLVPGLEMEGGAIIVDRAMSTNIEGIFAAGDCTGKPHQLAKAVGEGLVAALSAVQYIDRVDRPEKLDRIQIPINYLEPINKDTDPARTSGQAWLQAGQSPE